MSSVHYFLCVCFDLYFLIWHTQLNLLGEKDETPVHFCDKCGLPIKTYGRMVSIDRNHILILLSDGATDRYRILRSIASVDYHKF